ncbi:uncharacterized protein [Cicer arietinum]|uniref:Cell division cycle-associated 7-like protein isoform X1 n=1 Tax=Cicer arietinum TaxID=3827 RepID=A0A1S2Z057_CICAR|nr:cell division cycle-associated 7-like protein isoform X1 [Cicer arietinum]
MPVPFRSSLPSFSFSFSRTLFLFAFLPRYQASYYKVSSSFHINTRHVTVGQLTDCNKCELPQGQLCGDCLYTRYGENVTEANFNPKWTCPSCREICNCNSCRRRNGWMPTGNIYNKVTKLGFKSVAHYLIKTCRTEKSMKNSVAENIVAQETPETSPDSTLNRPIRTRRALRS